MKSYYIAILIICSLLSQQALAGFISVSMLSHGHMQSPQMAEMEISMNEHQAMVSHGDSSHNMEAMSHTASSDCCELDCQCDFACSFSLLIDLSSALPLSTDSQAIGQYSPELLAQSLDTLFRPPIFA